MATQNFQLNASGRIRIDESAIKPIQESGRLGLIIPTHIYLERVAHDYDDSCILQGINSRLLYGEQQATASHAISLPLPITLYEKREIELQLTYPLDIVTAAQIEKSRSGDIQLSFTFQLILTSTARARITLKNGSETSSSVMLAGNDVPNTALTITVPQSHWVKNVLPHLKVANYVFLEVPEPSGRLSSAWELIKRAEKSYFDSDQRAAFAHCREAGDALNNSLEKYLGKDSFEYQERWGRAFKHYSHYASLFLHLESIKSKSKTKSRKIEQPEKSDVEHALLTLKSLARYGDALLR